MLYHEMFGLLKLHGRVAKDGLPADIKQDMTLYIGYVTGTSNIEYCERCLQKTGFEGENLYDSVVWSQPLN